MIDRPCGDGCNNPACCQVRCCHPIQAQAGLGLYGEHGSLRRFTRAAKGIHDAAEKVRAMKKASSGQEVEAVARAIAKATNVEVTWPHFVDKARAAIAALDQVRGK